MWFEQKNIKFSLEIAVSAPLLNNIAYTYDIFSVWLPVLT